MALQQINVGTSANDGTGDALRDAFIKNNSNTTEIGSRLQTLETSTAQSVTGANESHVATDTIISCDTTSNDIEIALLPASSWTGKTLNIKKTASANAVIINPDSAELIDGASTFTFVNMNESITIMSDGTGIVIV